MRPIPLVAGLLAAGVFIPTHANAELVMTAPPDVAAGSGSTLLMRLLSLGDTDPSTGPVATVDGNSIRINLNDECGLISCDVISEHLFRADLPPLEEGDYAVKVHSVQGPDFMVDSFTLSVGPEAALPQVSPSGGFWKPVDMPGTGLHLQQRSGVLAVSQFEQVAGDADWRLDAVPLHGNSAIVLLRDYSGGSCFGCDPHVVPMPASDGMAMRIDFESARTATAMLADGTVVPLVNMSFGARYVDAPFDTGVGNFGDLALPDVSGKWAIGGGLVERIVTFGNPVIDGTAVRFEGDLAFPQVTFRCVESGGEPVCGLEVWNNMPPTAFYPALLGDITEDVIWFQDVDGRFAAVRIPEGGTEASAPPLPAAGFWTIPGKSGTGMHFQHRGGLLAVSQFDFVDQESHWRLGVAPLGPDGAEVALHSYSGGSCFGCTPHVAPDVDDEPPIASIVFDSARRATVDLGGDSVIPLANLPFGADYIDVQLPGGGDGQFGPLALPDLSGTWAFDLPEDVPGSRIAILEAQYLVVDTPLARLFFGGFVGEFLGGGQVEITCEPGNEVAPSGCELRIGDFQIGTPPPNWYPFARLGDIEEDRIRFVGGGGPGNDRVFYAVRIPTPAE